jgi:hypothetical protein
MRQQPPHSDSIRANPYLIDAIIGFSVVYKAFENMDGFRRVFGFQPNTKIAVLVFGFFHGFGLATKLQDFALSPNGLVANIVSFNVGVEIGQCLALTAILIALTWWRTRGGFLHHAFAFNGIVMACGFLLVGYQYKYRLDKGEALLYSWNATAPVDYDLHAEPDGAPAGYAQSYEKLASNAGIDIRRLLGDVEPGHQRRAAPRSRRRGIPAASVFENVLR